MPASSSLVSILTPSFNRACFVAETLESVLAQTHPNWELVVVDDGSTDGTKDIVSDYAARDPRIRLHDRKSLPKGACTCRNEGVRRSRGTYLMFLDTDDLITPSCLENRVRAMESHPNIAFGIFPSLMFENEPYDLGLWWNIDKPGTDELARQFRQDAICQGTGVLWRREAFERIGMWNTQLVIWQDIDLFFRAFIQGYPYAKFFDLPPDLHNRIDQKSLSRCGFFTPDKQQSRAEVIRRAVRLLREHGLAYRASEARFMTAEIISGAARSGQGRLALSLWIWAVREGVFSPSAALRVAASLGLTSARLGRLAAGRALVRRLERPFASEGTLGRLPYREA